MSKSKTSEVQRTSRLAQRGKLTCLIPCYNGAKTVGEVISKIPKSVAKIIVVNDGSTDNTADVLKKVKDRRLVILTHKKNKGYGGSQKTLFNAALKDNADYYVAINADLAHEPREIDGMLDTLIKGNYDYVTGSRILGLWKSHKPVIGSKTLGVLLKGKMPPILYLGNRVLTLVQNILFGTNIISFHDGYRIFNRKTLESVPFNDFLDGYFFDTEFLISAIKMKLKGGYYPASTFYSKKAGSRPNYLGYSLGLLKMALRYRLTGKLH